MINEILHVRARCGAGKSRETIKELISYLLSQPSVNDIYLFASKTNDLTGQNYRYVEEVVQNHVNGKNLSVKMIDSNSNKGTVVRDLAALLASGFKGVIFISHSALASISADRLKGARVVVDEVPDQLVGHLIVKHHLKDHNYPWEKYLVNTHSVHDTYMRVRLDPNADKDDVQRYIDRIRKKKDNTTTNNVADLLEFLLADYEALYISTKSSDGTLTRFYQAVHYDRLVGLVNNVSFLAILSAQVKNTLLGFIAQYHLNLPITEKDINDQTTLVQKHKNRVRIIPFLKDGRWSTSLRKKTTKDALSINNHAVQSNLQVRVFAQEFAAKFLGQEDFLITLNQDDKLIDSLLHVEKYRTSTKVYGMNHLKHLDHAVYLASTNPTPIELNSARLFSKDNGLDVDTLIHAIMVESCYETAYQCIARISIRESQVKPDQEHVIIVPDMNYAEYIATWFEKGCAFIDIQHSYSTIKNNKQQNREDYYLTVIIQILTEYSLNKGKLKDLLNNFGMSRSTYKRYKEKFRTELEKENLLKPKKESTAISSI